jgi:glycyl-tRNA synthetase beta subunit
MTTKEIMKKITEQAIEAFMNAKPFKKDNTVVWVRPNVTVLLLFENEIAYRYNDPERTISITNCGWKTNTTKERLNGIPNVHIRQKKGDWYLNGTLWDGKLIDVK